MSPNLTDRIKNISGKALKAALREQVITADMNLQNSKNKTITSLYRARLAELILLMECASSIDMLKETRNAVIKDFTR